MRVLVTGGSGFIGARVVRLLIEHGDEVALLALPGDPLTRLEDVAGRIEVIRADLGALDAVRPAIAAFAPAGCIHLAWYAEPGLYLTSTENLPALANSLALLQLVLDAGCRNVVMAGTCAEYDTDVGFLREDGPTRPATLYAATKLSMSLIGRELCRLRDARFAWGRVFYLYGPGEDPRRAIPALINALLASTPFDASEGSQVRDYLHVDDVASGFVTLLEKNADGVFNIASGQPATMREIMETVARLVGKPELVRFGAAPVRKWEPPVISGDATKLKGLGWAPQYSLNSGLRAAIEFWGRG